MTTQQTFIIRTTSNGFKSTTVSYKRGTLKALNKAFHQYTGSNSRTIDALINKLEKYSNNDPRMFTGVRFALVDIEYLNDVERNNIVNVKEN